MRVRSWIFVGIGYSPVNFSSIDFSYFVVIQKRITVITKCLPMLYDLFYHSPHVIQFSKYFDSFWLISRRYNKLD